MAHFDETWVGPTGTTSGGSEERTVLDRVRDPDATVVDRHPGSDELAPLSADMLEELRLRLREAEAREGSGVRERPTPEEGIARDALPSAPHAEVAPVQPIVPAPTVQVSDSLVAELDRIGDRVSEPDLDLDIEVEEPRTLDELDEVLSALPEVEVALAPQSESNFYCGFDETHPDGVFVATYEDLPEGTPVYVKVHLPAGYRFRTPAIVEWRRPPEASTEGLPAGVGLKMCGLDHRMWRLIRSFARHRKPIFYVG